MFSVYLVTVCLFSAFDPTSSDGFPSGAVVTDEHPGEDEASEKTAHRKNRQMLFHLNDNVAKNLKMDV